MVINLGGDPIILVEFTRYYVQLFTHNRSNIWKGNDLIRSWNCK